MDTVADRFFFNNTVTKFRSFRVLASYSKTGKVTLETDVSLHCEVLDLFAELIKNKLMPGSSVSFFSDRPINTCNNHQLSLFLFHTL